MCMLKEVLLMYRYCDLLFGRPVLPQSPSCPVWLPRAGPGSQDMAGRPPLSPAWGCGSRAGLLPWQHLPSSQIARTLSPPMNGEEGLTDRWGGRVTKALKGGAADSWVSVWWFVSGPCTFSLLSPLLRFNKALNF